MFRLMMVGEAEVAAAVQVEVAPEAGGEAEVAGRAQMLLAADQKQGALHHGTAEDGVDLRILERGEVNAADLDAAGGFQLAHLLHQLRLALDHELPLEDRALLASLDQGISEVWRQGPELRSERTANAVRPSQPSVVH